MDYHSQVVLLRRALREAHDPPLPRLRRSPATFTQAEITSAVLRANPQLDTQGLQGFIKVWRRIIAAIRTGKAGGRASAESAGHTLDGKSIAAIRRGKAGGRASAESAGRTARGKSIA